MTELLFCFTMDDLKNQIRKKEEENIEAKRGLLQITQHELSEVLQQLGKNNALWRVLTHSFNIQYNCHISQEEFEQFEAIPKIEETVFVSECLQAVKSLHLQIYEHDLTIMYTQETIKNLKLALSQLEKVPDFIKSSENCAIISYTKNISDIFQFYRVKFKLVDENEQYTSIYSQNNQKTCIIPLSADTQFLKFAVLGKKQADSAFKPIAYITQPLDDILAQIKPRNFQSELIPSVYYSLYYEDQIYDSPCQNQLHHFELKFDLRLTQELRLATLRKLILYQQATELQFNKEVLQKLEWIQQILMPFPRVKYLRSQGLVSNHSDRKMCDCNLQ